MNRIKSVAWAVMNANPGSSGGGEKTGLPVELIGAMPESARTPSGPVGRDWSAAGRDAGQAIIAAEQGIVVAEQSLAQTKVSKMIEMASLSEVERATYIGGMDNAFIMSDGDKKTKGHQNIVADFRRVHFALKVEPTEKLLAILTGKGTYPEKMEKIPKASNRGGQNAGTGVKAAIEATKQAAEEHGAENVTVSGKAPLSEAPKPKEAPESVNRDQIVNELTFAHENDLEAIGVAYANRLKKSTNTDWQEVGGALLDLIDSISPEVRAAKSVEHPAAKPAVNE